MNQGQWAGSVAVCLASGPSLTPDDVERVRHWQGPGRYVLVANTTFKAAPWADVLYAQDAKWWREYFTAVKAEFKGAAYSGQSMPRHFGAHKFGLPKADNFCNSGAAIISMSIYAGCEKVILLGFDCKRGPNGEVHHHGNHPKGMSNAASMISWPKRFARVAELAANKGVEVVNCSRGTALTCFARAELDDVLDS